MRNHENHEKARKKRGGSGSRGDAENAEEEGDHESYGGATKEEVRERFTRRKRRGTTKVTKRHEGRGECGAHAEPRKRRGTTKGRKGHERRRGAD
jgi:hypothetical protein